MKRKGTAKGKSHTPTSELEELSPGGHALAALGSEVKAVVREYLGSNNGEALFTGPIDAGLKEIGHALGTWTNNELIVAFLRRYFDLALLQPSVDQDAVCRWLRLHVDDPLAVIDCASVEPPDKVSIIRRLSRAGSQKVVFLAIWKPGQKQIALKRFHGNPEQIRKVLEREATTNPLSMRHRNIIETQFFDNKRGETFLVEEYLRDVLNDEWRSDGVHEAANLLYDIGNAITYLHEDLNLVHGDIKPDNIGKRGQSYILLDFGICRLATEFSKESSATGSLRTRAPELLADQAYATAPEKADVWALGATVYNAVAGRFPLFDLGEKPPRISTPEERSSFEAVLAERAEQKWSEYVDFHSIPDALKKPLKCALEKNPDFRASAQDLKRVIESELSAFLRPVDQSGWFSPLEQLDQLSKLLPDKDVVALMPAAERHTLRNLVEQLKGKIHEEDVARRAADLLLRIG